MVAMGVAEGRNPGKQRANSSYTANWPGETPAVWRGGSGSQHCCIVTIHLQATKSPSPSLLALSTHLGPELLRQSLGLVLHHGWVEVPPALTAGLFARLKLLRRGSVCSHSTHTLSSHPHTDLTEPFVNLRDGLLNSHFLYEGTGEFCVVCTELLARLFDHHLLLLRTRLRGWGTGRRREESKERQDESGERAQ